MKYALYRFLAACSIILLLHSMLYAQGRRDLSYYADRNKIDYGNPKEYTLAGVTVEGANFNDKNSLISIAGFKIGEKIKIPGDDISTAVRKLWKLGIIGDVSISVAEIDGNDVFLKIEIRERPRLSRYFFEGIPKGQVSTVSDKVKLIKGRIVTDAMVKNARNTIISHFAEKGFKNTTVKVVQQKDTLLANGVILRFEIDRKTKVKIEEIAFTGVEEMEEKKLKKKMKKTKEARFGRIFTPSKFIAAEYREDKDKLIAFYNKEGYRNAAILNDTVYDVSPERVSIRIDMEEGHKFYYRDISWTGNYKYTDQQLSEVLGIKKGDVYNPEELNKRLNFNPNGLDITSLYMDDGYLFFSIKPVEVKIEADSIDVEMVIFEGEQANVNKIILNGNTRTNDHVVFREIRTLPGEKFSRSDLIRTQRELSTIGYFDPEQIGLNPKPNFADETVDIQYDVVERPNDQIELSGGWGGMFGFVGTMGVVFNNFSARKLLNPSAWKGLPQGDGQRLALRMQANGRRFQTYSFTFTEPWMGGRRPNAFTINLSHSVQRLIGFDNRSRGSLKVNGATVSLGRRLRFPDDFFTMRNDLSFLVYDLDNFNTQGFGRYNTGLSYNFTFRTEIARNSIDNPTFPRSGSSMSLNMSFTPPYSLMGPPRDYAGLDAQDRFRLVEYHKWMFDNSWFMKLAGNLVLSTRAHMGFIGMYNRAKGLGPFERFILGGDGMILNNFLLGTEIIGLRGYQNSSILPFESDGTGGVVYNKYVMELRYPVSLNPAATIFVQTFIEGGNNWGTFDEFNPFDLKRSAGVGARIFMPAFGMLGIDWAYGFDRIPGNPDASGAQFHFTIGQQIR